MLNAAIYGMGRWGKTLVSAVQGKSDKIRFVSGVARTPDSHRDFAEQAGFNLTGDYESVLSDPEIQAVVLATPHSQHAGDAQRAAAAGKHVFVEKPFTLTLAQAQAAASACEDAGVVLAIGFNRRHRPAFKALEQAVTGGRIGEIMHIEGQFSGPSGYKLAPGTWRGDRAEMPGGGMCPRGVHVLDLMTHLCGEVENIYSQTSRRVLDAVEVDDSTSMLLRFRSGVSGYLASVFATADLWRITVYGSQGWAEMQGEFRVVVSDLDGKLDTVDFEENDAERAELEAFADAVAGRDDYPVSVAEAVHGAAVLEAMVKSYDSDQPVRIP